MKYLAYALCALLSCALCNGCGEKDAQAWHAEAVETVGGRALRTLDPQVLATAQYAERQALALDSTMVDAALGLAALYEAQGAYEEATLLYRQLVERHSDMGIAYARLGFSLAAQGRYSGAQRAYQDALRRGERSASLYARLGHAYAALGHVDEHLQSARAAYRAALQMDAQIADVHAHLARVEARLGRRDEAQALYAQALEVDADDVMARLELAALYREMGQPHVGRGVLADGLARRADSPLLHQEMGRFIWEDGDAQRALEHIERARKLAPDLPLAQRYAALLYSTVGRADDALAVYAELAAQNPQDASVWVSMGIVHSQRGDWQRAEGAFKQALTIGGDGGDAALKLGGLYVHRGRLRPAVKVFSDGVAQYPDNAELHASLGDVYRQLGVLGAALDAGEASVRLEPERALWRYHLAATYERAYPERARAEWQRYMELARDDEREQQRLRDVENKWQGDHD